MTVAIGLDAASEKKLTGVVTYLANIGEQRPNSDSKVFEVHVSITEKDTTLRPAMTTSNKILVDKVPNALFIPIECVHNENGKNYVYKKSPTGPVKQAVTLGLMNDAEVIIKSGVAPQDELYLSPPAHDENPAPKS